MDKKQVTIYLTEDMHKALKIKAVQDEKSISDLVQDAISKILEDKK